MFGRRERFFVDRPSEAFFRRPGHHHMIVVTPVDHEFAAVDADRYTAAGQATAMGRDRCGAGARAAGERQSNVALPYPQTQGIGSDQLGDADIRAFGKDRIVFELGPEGLDRSTKKTACGFPTLTATGSESGPSESGR